VDLDRELAVQVVHRQFLLWLAVAALVNQMAEMAVKAELRLVEASELEEVPVEAGLAEEAEALKRAVEEAAALEEEVVAVALREEAAGRRTCLQLSAV
jgi:hypothetical protein